MDNRKPRSHARAVHPTQDRRWSKTIFQAQVYKKINRYLKMSTICFANIEEVNYTYYISHERSLENERKEQLQ